MLVVGCVDLTRPPELIPSVADAAFPGLLEPDARAAPAADAAGFGAQAASDGGGGTTIPAVVLDAMTSTSDGPAPSDSLAAPDAAAPLPRGRRCTSGAQCGSGFCAQGFCCDSPCTGVCQACDVAGQAGTCTPVPAGQNPANQCPREAPGTCGRDGTCDGKGGCRRYPAGTECVPGSCTGAIEYSARTCDGAGSCQPGTRRPCMATLCQGNSCGGRCASSADCQMGFFCEGGSCQVKRPLGASCGNATECASASCADGVCCNGPCAGTCQACNLSGSLGSCSPVPEGLDPAEECPMQPAQSCGSSGGCDGKGGCRRYGAGTPCGLPRSCTGATETAATTCDGFGSCVAGGTRGCGPYLCNQDSCATSCQTAAQCQAGLLCLGGACVPPRIADLMVADAANAAGWSRQVDFQTGPSGAHPWSDYPDSYVATLEAGAEVLRGAEWVRVSAASKNFDGGGGSQATITLSGTSDVYLIVDDRWGSRISAFTAGWADTGTRLRVFESSSRPALGFGIFRKAAQRGKVTLPNIGANTAYDNFVVVN
jgi:hypothetical protein